MNGSAHAVTAIRKKGDVPYLICPLSTLCSHSAAHPFSERIMKSAVFILGIAAVLMGLLWIGQGTGLVQWPASSFMIDQRPWVARGAILAVAGLILIAFSRKR